MRGTIAISLEAMMRAEYILYHVCYGSDLLESIMPTLCSELFTRTAHLLLNGPGLFTRQNINYMNLAHPILWFGQEGLLY